MAGAGGAPQAGTGGLITPELMEPIRRVDHDAGVQIDFAALPDDPATLQQMLREMVAETEQQATLQHAVQQRDAEIDKLHLLIKRLLRQQFGRRSEQ